MDSVASGSQSSFIFLSRNKLSEFLRSCTSRDITEKINFLVAKVENETNIEISEEIKKNLTNFAYEHRRRWLSASRNNNTFLKQNINWLQCEISFPCRAHGLVGRPQMDFSDLSERSKRRKTEDLRFNYSAEELSYAAQMQLRERGKLDSSNVMKNIIFSTPSRAEKYQKALKKMDQDQVYSIYSRRSTFNSC
ncbi:uncharacterized protein LOC129941567 [Eupeodes corollae]|uniref:uncharacterized protein LOC129941567 n=1 Tax=Eupeodes corollae TaxID=290404 RepID=UPI002490DAFB|nr:uncharacterized protein LOC129941567 [Eupeodes corollae]